MVKLNLTEEKRLAEQIRKFSCLFEKGNEGYKEKDKKKTHGVKWRMPSVTKKVRNLNDKVKLCSVETVLS